MDVRELWDGRFTQGLPSLETPDPFFIEMYEQHISKSYPSGGKVLDLAAGLGRHSLFLAEHQWKATAVDISAVAIEKLKETALSLNVHIDALIMDIEDYDLPAESFDLIILYYHFDRALFAKIFNALKPGGLFICKQAFSNIPKENAPLQKEELLTLVSYFDMISHHERPVKDRGVVEYLGRKKQ
ncbi:Methyltransferase domain-containing protein [Chitinophaga sp. YR573]|uniref:class I SAM-dependent methyltransferase n=1 Tax=Chitinophaga sp. YR573 TaxID=1881040 RepID=UPI0008CA3C70|nr:class I SAM-dependent methyltransferase [Chitinophaga sp. YR573]SEW45168.1 Methyltransferase domain-containing protein [Chitinophaga sp. YR573]